MRMMAAIACLAPALAACNSVPVTRLASLSVVADPDANGGNSTALDVVFVFTPAAVAALPATGPEWFLKGAALQADQADAVKVVHLELPPAHTADVDLPAGYKKAIGVYSFANYIPAPGQPRGNLTPYTGMTIRLAKDGIKYAPR